jgi:hypothetical protein
MELLAVNTSMFYIRLENLADSDFDTYYAYYEEHENETDIDIPIEDEIKANISEYVNLDKLLGILIKKHLSGLDGVTFKIEETSLTGLELYPDMAGAKTGWTSYDDEWIDESWLPHDPERKEGDPQLITLEPQRIRTFRVSMVSNYKLREEV